MLTKNSVFWFSAACGLVIVFASFLASGKLSHIVLFRNDDTVISVFAAIGAPVLAGVAVLLTWKSYQMNRSLALAGRFQKGAEMLASDHTSTNRAGMVVLRQVAQEKPELYWSIVVSILIEFAARRDSTFKARLSPFDVNSIKFTGFIPRCDVTGAQAIVEVSRILPTSQKWPSNELALLDNRLEIPDVFFSAGQIPGAVLRNCNLNHWILHHCQISGCDFSNSRLDLAIGAGIEFIGCDFTDAKIRLWNLDGDRLTQPQPVDILEIIGGNWTNAYIGKIPMAEWVAAAAALPLAGFDKTPYED